MTPLVLSDHRAALDRIGPADLAVPYLSPDELPHEPRRLLLDIGAALSATTDPAHLVTWLTERIDRVRHLDRLHAKVAIGDDSAFLGSANFTRGGLDTNVEAGVLITDPDHLKTLLTWFDNLYHEARAPSPADLRAYLDRLPTQTPARPRFTIAAPAETFADDILDHLATFRDADTAHLHLATLARVTRELGIGTDDERVCVSLPRSGWGPRLSVGTAWVMLPTVLAKDGSPGVSLLLPHGLRPENGIERESLAAGDVWDLPLTDDVLDRNPGWLAAAGPLLETRRSRHRRYHHPDAWRLIHDEPFRHAAIAEAFRQVAEAEAEDAARNAAFWDRFATAPRPLGTAPSIVQYWKEASVVAQRDIEGQSSGSADPRLLHVRPGGDLWIVTHAGKGRIRLATRIIAREGGEPDPRWYVVRGDATYFDGPEDPELPDEILGLRPNNRVMQLRSLRILTETQAAAMRGVFAAPDQVLETTAENPSPAGSYQPPEP